MSYKIVLYGRLGDLMRDNLTVVAPAPQSASWILEEVGQRISAAHPQLKTEIVAALEVSALADEVRILPKNQPVPFGEVHIIPPVNGG